MKLLVDEMFPPTVAVRLREQFGHDVIAVTEDAGLLGLSDWDVFKFAQAEGRAIVTEDVADYRILGRDWEAAGGVHHGLIFTSNRKFPRAKAETIGRLIAALNELLRSRPGTETPSNLEIWL